ncbi:MAG: SUMF1/EgtB/PvdO family nonheme iron enzyme [Caldilineaceae bacterium]
MHQIPPLRVRQPGVAHDIANKRLYGKLQQPFNHFLLVTLLCAIQSLLMLSLLTRPALLAQNRHAIGHIHFANFNQTRAGKIFLDIDQLETPPTDHHYEVWLKSSPDKFLSLGELTLAAGAVHFSAEHREHLLEEYTTLLITLEADNQSGDLPSNQVVLSVDFDKSAFGPLQSFFAPTQEVSKGLLFGASEQLRLALFHSQLLEDALAKNDRNTARVHVEHIVNITNGKLGELYGDLNQNGQTEDPGDGFGVIAYLQAVEEKLAAVKTSLITTDTADSTSSAVVSDTLQPALADLQQSESDGASATELIAKVISQDSVKEIVDTGYYEEGITYLKQIDSRLLSAYAVALPNVTFTLYADQLVPISKLPPAVTVPITPTLAAITTTAPVHDHAAQPPVLQLPGNSQPGSRWQNPVDGGEYLFVAGGEFTMGANKGETTFVKEQPAHKQTVGSFWLQTEEVTNEQYSRCVKAKVCSEPANDQWQQLIYAKYPVTHVTWEQAMTYATWAGGRLPSEAEWEHACRASDNRTYPWGEQQPSTESANFNNPAAGADEVGSFLSGASADGLLDLSGNVAEWTSSLDKPYPYAKDDGREDPNDPGKRIARGGSFIYSHYQLRCFSRLALKPSSANRDVGFRVLIESQSGRWQNPVDGGEYLYVAGGEFTMGANKGETTFVKEQPAHKQTVGSFWLQSEEVTNEQYSLCVKAKVCSEPANDQWQQLIYAKYPVTHVTWEQAMTYATWAGGRLPSEAEWEHACRASDNRTYPWGEQQPSTESANFNNPAAGADEVGSFLSGASADGLLDLSGNVAEWTSSLDKPYPYAKDDGREDPNDPGKRIARGGSFIYSYYQLRCFSRLALKPSSANRDVGFRVLVEADVVK